MRQAQADLAHVNRVTTMGELTASLAHEVNQPIAAAVTDANTCLRWLARDHPDLEEARAAAMRIVKDATRAAEIISRIRLLFNKGTPERELVDVNEVIREMIVLLRSEAMRYNISVRTELAADLPQVMGDRVQLQQVLMNLMINGIDAMKDVDGTRELAIKSQRAENEQLWCPSAIPAWGFPRSRRTRSSMRSLPPNLTAPAWDFRSAARSLNRMAAACGLPTTLRAAPTFISRYPRNPGTCMTTAGDPTVFVIDDDDVVRAAIQGLLKSVGLRSETFGTAKQFLGCKRPDGPSCLVLDVQTSWSQRSGFSAAVG